MVSRADLTLRSLKTRLVKILNRVLTSFFWSNFIILLTRRHNIGKNLEGLGLRKNEKDGHPSNPKQFITAFFGKSEGGSWCGHDHPSLPHCGCCGCTMGPKKNPNSYLRLSKTDSVVQKFDKKQNKHCFYLNRVPARKFTRNAKNDFEYL